MRTQPQAFVENLVRKCPSASGQAADAARAQAECQAAKPTAKAEELQTILNIRRRGNEGFKMPAEDCEAVVCNHQGCHLTKVYPISKLQVLISRSPESSKRLREQHSLYHLPNV
jgi:hypothetical protein